MINISEIAKDAAFYIECKEVTVTKRYYSGETEDIIFDTIPTAIIKRSSDRTNVDIIISNIDEFISLNILKGNISLTPTFDYQIDNDGDEFARAEINNSFASMFGEDEYVSFFAITKQQDEIISYVINNLPNEQGFYYLISFYSNYYGRGNIARTIEPFVFESNQHLVHKENKDDSDLIECKCTITVEKNTNECDGYQLEAGKGYIVNLFNNDLGRPQISDKPMIVVRKSSRLVELRGFPILAQVPSGWQEVDYSKYGLSVHYDHGRISKCVLNVYDRKEYIEYLQVLENPARPHGLRITRDDMVIKYKAYERCTEYPVKMQYAKEQGWLTPPYSFGDTSYKSLLCKDECIFCHCPFYQLPNLMELRHNHRLDYDEWVLERYKKFK